MARPLENSPSGPGLSPETHRRVDILFSQADREPAKTLLRERCGNNLPFQEKAGMYRLERFRFAALKYSDGNLSRLEKAVTLAQRDWRDLLMAVGFAHDSEAHRNWEPKPAGEPAEVDPLLLAAALHEQLAAVLSPLGFERQNDEWRRAGEIPQTVRLITGLTNRIETRFFLRVRLEAKPPIMLHLPKLPRLDEAREQGYIFRTGDKQQALCAAVLGDVIRYAEPVFQRFTSGSEVKRGLDDGTFRTHLEVEGEAWIF